MSDVPNSDYFPKRENVAEQENQTKFSSGAVRCSDADDTRYDLLSPFALRRVARAHAEGAKKYGDHNWRKGIPQSNLLNHLLRHLALYQMGDTSEDHLGHAAWNLHAMIHVDEVRPELCDVREYMQQEGGNSSANLTSSQSANSAREPLVYLASPYSKYEGGRDDAHFLVCEYAAALIERGVRVFSPIAHSHPIADAGEVDPIAHDVWMPLDLAILDRCDVLAVLCLAGWNDSIGVTEEIRHAIDAGKPVVYLDPDEGDLRKIVGQLKIDFFTSQN